MISHLQYIDTLSCHSLNYDNFFFPSLMITMESKTWKLKWLIPLNNSLWVPTPRFTAYPWNAAVDTSAAGLWISCVLVYVDFIYTPHTDKT